jgi:flagellar basal-body rod protein FlgB
MLDKFTESFSFSGEALKLRARRQEVLTSNIANVDTPNYKSVDFKFKDALQEVTAESPSSMTQASQMAVTHAGHISNASSANASTQAMLEYRRGNNPSLDNNTVDIEKERAAFAENTVKYEAALRSINGQISIMKQAMGSN